ncbi:392_t:CDS:2 [Cetraspora pellucida]|uniref:392_t:CDS:1 n=1 Tax=Cetraspora pellucida TaxID=1433469 RepID=A0ACA9NTP2_9GLOM|nr:392_t:CDS:2 [Cetraspora pellucida]
MLSMDEGYQTQKEGGKLKKINLMNLILTKNLELQEVNYKNNENVFNDAILNEDQADNIELINFQK